MHILEIAKIKYVICLQFRYTKQAKNMLFANFGHYSKDGHLTAKGYQNIIFFEIAKMWKKLKNVSFFYEIVVKSYFNRKTNVCAWFVKPWRHNPKQE